MDPSTDPKLRRSRGNVACDAYVPRDRVLDPNFAWALHRERDVKVKEYWKEHRYMKKAHLRALSRRTSPFEGWELANVDLSEPMQVEYKYHVKNKFTGSGDNIY